MPPSPHARGIYELIRSSSAHAFGDKNALAFMRDGNPATPPIRWTYAQLLECMHRSVCAARRAPR